MKINYKKIIVTVLWIIALSGLTTTLAFVEKKEEKILTKDMEINILNNQENQFLDEEDIKLFFDERNDEVLNTERKNVNINALEKSLNSHPAIENADFSIDVNGGIYVNVVQRTPLVRIINLNGESYYIDTQSKLMPLSDKYTARVLVVNGMISEPYVRRSMYSIEEIIKNEKFSEVSCLDEIYKLARFISNDSILEPLIQQMYLNEEKEFEMIPVIGNHKIIFGDISDMEEKFEKLKVFYTEGLNKTDNWNKYSMINLKYKNQVVCTKK